MTPTLCDLRDRAAVLADALDGCAAAGRAVLAMLGSAGGVCRSKSYETAPDERVRPTMRAPAKPSSFLGGREDRHDW